MGLSLNGARWLRYVPLAVALVLIVSVAVVQGLWSDRWTDPAEDSRALAAALQRVPTQIGDWEAEELTASAAELEASGAVGHVARAYTNRLTGDRVTLFIICGHMRDVAVHTPDRCYPAAGFKQLGENARYTLGAGESAVDFFTSRFRLEAPEGIQNHRVFWTWGHGDRWHAPQWPRGEFRGVRALYKLYLVSSLPNDQPQALDDSAAIAFGKALFPELTPLLFPSAAAAATADAG